MKNKFYLLIILFPNLLWACAHKPVYTCGNSYLANRPKIESKVLKLERIGIADTTVAFISAKILGKDSTSAGTTIDTLIYAKVYLVDKVRAKTIAKATDLNGEFDFTVPSGLYDLQVQHIAYNTLIIRDMHLGTGDLVELKAVLGQSGTSVDSTEYKLTHKWSLEAIK